jgi:hypothetical protein
MRVRGRKGFARGSADARVACAAPQVWRLLTNFLFVGKFSMNFVMSLMWMCVSARARRCAHAESVRRQTATLAPRAPRRDAAPHAAPPALPPAQRYNQTPRTRAPLRASPFYTQRTHTRVRLCSQFCVSLVSPSAA